MNSYFAILPIFSAAACIALGLFTLLRNPRHPANMGFALGMASLAVIEAGGVIALLSGPGKDIGVHVSLAGEAILPAAWLPFSLAFARANHKEILSRHKAVMAGVCAVSILFIVWTMRLSLMPEGAERSVFDYEALFVAGRALRFFHIYLILALVLNLVHLENTLRSSTGSKRWQIKYLIFGVGGILAYFIYLSSQALLFSYLSMETIPLTSSVILISSTMMAVFIVRHRLLDVDIFISRYVVYNSLTVLTVGLYLLSIGIFAYGIRYFQIPFNYFFATIFIFISILALVVFLFTASLRRKFQLFINRHFYKHKYEFRDKWMETIEKISSKRSAEEITATLKEMILVDMGANPVYLWLYDPASRSYMTEQTYLLKKGYGKIPSDNPFALHLKNSLSPFTAKGAVPGDAKGAGISALFNDTGTILCAPLVADHEVMGFMLLGPDMSKEPYIQDDFEFLKAVTTQAAVQIKNIKLSQELLSAREVEAFSKMSYFIMHDLKNLTNSLSLISQNARHNIDNPEFQQDAIRTIDGTVARMKGLIERLSSVPKEIELKKENSDILRIVGSALKNIVLPEGKYIDITFTSSPEVIPPIEVDPEAIEMVILNLIMNAYDAIRKDGHIRVHSLLNGGFIHLTVSDNGYGMSREYIDTALFRPFKTTKKKGFGIGLYQCKSIIEAHGGSIEVESEEGKGTTFTVKLPLRKDVQ